MKVHLTYNESIKIFMNTAHHLKLEEDRIEVSRLNTDIYMIGLIS